MKNILFVTLIVLIYGCKKEGLETTYFGGEIVNPNEKAVVLLHNNVAIDTAELDDQNRFMFKLDNLRDGLYHFMHKPEYQYLILEKGDSVMLRLNTLDFDESLVFTGRGAEKNNFLIDMFLFNEDEEMLVDRYEELESGAFKAKLDSLRAMKYEQLNNLTANFEVSNLTENIVKGSIDYMYFTYLEKYPEVHRRSLGLKHQEPVDADFYDFRKNIDYNNENLSYFRNYVDFMKVHFDNLAKSYCTDDYDSIKGSSYSLHYYTHKLHIIDSLVQESSLRGNLLRNTAFTYLFHDHNPENNKIFIDELNKLSDNIHSAEINELYSNIVSLEAGNIIPEVELVNIEGAPVTLRNIGKDNKTIYYFWSLNQKKHIKYIYKRILQLKEKYPQFNYVGINLDESETAWANYVKAENLDPAFQYHGLNESAVKRKYIINQENKLIITDKNGIIINAFADAFDMNIDSELNNSMLVKL